MLHRLENPAGTHRGTRRSLHRKRKAWPLFLLEEMERVDLVERPLFEAPTTRHLDGCQMKPPHSSRDDFDVLNHFKSNVSCVVTAIAEQAIDFKSFRTFTQPMSNHMLDPVTPQMLPRISHSSGETADPSQIYEAASHYHSSQIAIVRPITELP
jgi:hypothetical protein